MGFGYIFKRDLTVYEHGEEQNGVKGSSWWRFLKAEEDGEEGVEQEERGEESEGEKIQKEESVDTGDMRREGEGDKDLGSVEIIKPEEAVDQVIQEEIQKVEEAEEDLEEEQGDLEEEQEVVVVQEVKIVQEDPPKIVEDQTIRKKHKPRMSAKQRREEKKSREGTQSSITPPPAPVTKKEKGPKPKEFKKGQKHRQKKQKKKYGEQTEEERRLAMRSLGHVLDEDVVEETASQAEVAFHPKKKEQQVLFKDDKLINESERHDFDGFTSFPLETDVLLFAMPFCGPIASMAHFKYRAKLQPGSMKRSKAVKNVLALFAQSANARERDVMREVADGVNTMCMVSDVKVSAAGMKKVEKSLKKKRKKGKKRL